MVSEVILALDVPSREDALRLVDIEACKCFSISSGTIFPTRWLEPLLLLLTWVSPWPPFTPWAARR